MSLTVKRPTIEGMPSPAARAASTQDGGAAPPMRLDVMRSLRKRPRLAAGVGGAVFLLAFLFGLLRKPVYQAESLIYIEPLASKVLSDGTSGSYDAGRYDSYFQQQMQTALRPDILASAIEKLPPFVWQRGGESMQSAVMRLQNSLKVQRVLTSYQLSISLVYASPQASAAVVNAVTNSYLEQGRKDEHAVTNQRLQLLGEERQRIQQQLGEDRVEQASLGGVLGLADGSGKTASPFDAQIAGVQTQVAGAREAKDVAAAQYAVVQGTGSPALTAAAEEQMATDAGLNSMKQTISQRKALLSTQMAGLTPSNPIYKQDQDEIADLDRSLDAMTQQIREKAERRLQDKLRADLQRTSDVEGRLNAELRHQTATATSSVPKLQRAQELNADIQRLTARFTVVDDAMRSLELESNGPGSAHLSVPATVPASPEPSKRKLILGLSLPLGCFAGLFAAVFAHRMDPRIYSAPDVEHVLGFSPIGVLPARSEVSGRTMEEYTLRLAAGLQSAYRVSSAQSFVFTAASATMQTSEFVQSIARILGTLGFKALVMDASSVLHAAHRTQAAETRDGSAYRSAALVRTIEGTRQGYAGEELERLKLKYDLLLIDAPPLLTSAETEYLVRCTDATILVAESGTTVKTELYQSALLLQHLNVAGVGAVLQELHLKDAEPAFRAAIEAVERLQGGRADRLEQEAPPEPLGTEEAVEETRADEALEPGAGAEERVESTVTAEPVTLPAEAEPVEARAEVPKPVPVTEHLLVEEPDQVRSWKSFLKRTPERAEETEPVVTPVMPAREEAARDQDAEPVIYFQDRLRAHKAAETRVDPVAVKMQQTEGGGAIHVDPAPMYVEPVQVEAVAVEPVPLARELEPAVESATLTRVEEAEPVAEVGEAVVPPAAEAEDTVAAGVFGRTTVESGTEAHGWLVGGPELKQVAAEHVAESAAEVADESESLMEAYVERIDALPDGAAQTEAGKVPEVLEPVMEAAVPVAQAAPAVRREPAPPKMGWFTLKFRGTTERVLRIIPGEEGDEVEPASGSVTAGTSSVEAETEVHARTAEAAQVADEYEVIHAEEAVAGEPKSESYASAMPMVPPVEEEAPISAEQAQTHDKEQSHAVMAAEKEPEAFEEQEVGARAETEAVPHAVPTEEHEALPMVQHASSQAASSQAAEDVDPFEKHVEEARMDEAFAQAEEIEEPLSFHDEEAEASAGAEPVHEATTGELVEEPAAVQPERVVVEAHTPVKSRWTVRDLHQDELEREWHGDHAAVVTRAPLPQAATLMSELRSRAAAMPVRDEPGVKKHPSGRRSGAPVEERLEPRAASLTRRWEMLSRFDAASAEAQTPKAGS